MTNQNKGTINILFVCYGNISRGIPIGLNIWTEKCKRRREELKNHD